MFVADVRGATAVRHECWASGPADSYNRRQHRLYVAECAG